MAEWLLDAVGGGCGADDGYAHAGGRRIVRAGVPIVIISGSWHFAGRSRSVSFAAAERTVDAAGSLLRSMKSLPDMDSTTPSLPTAFNMDCSADV